jgi:hypothetical protein
MTTLFKNKTTTLKIFCKPQFLLLDLITITISLKKNDSINFLMMKNEYYDTINRKSDEELLEMYRNLDDYVEKAQETIIDLLKKRDLFEQAYELRKQDLIEQERVNKEKIKRFETEIFGSYESNVEFANKSLIENRYYRAVFSANHKENSFGTISLLIGVLGATSLLIFILTKEYKQNLLLYWAAPSLFFSLFLFVGIKAQKSAKSLVELYRKNENSIALKLQMKDELVEINFPFKYEYCWTYLQNVKPKIKQVNLWIFIYKNEEKLISLNETLDASKFPPPHWEQISIDDLTPKAQISLTNYGFQSSNLYKLQKILDGLREQN